MSAPFTPQTEKLVKKRSPAGGLGLFATDRIAKGSFIIEYTGEKITSKEADRRGGKYLFELNSRYTIDGKERSNLARYINHSCKPNCEVELIAGKLMIFAKKRIKAGSELRYDYGEEFLKDPETMPDGCKCEECV